MDKKAKIVVSILVPVLLVSFALEIAIGPVNIPVLESLFSLFLSPGTNSEALLTLRLTRALVALSAGVALSVSGVVYQSVFSNPMAEPYLLGASAGASFFVSLTFFLSDTLKYSTYSVLPLAGFTGAFVSILLSVLLSRKGKRIPTYRLLLTGIAVSFFFSALTPLVMVLSGKNLYSIFFFLTGTTQGRSLSEAIFFTAIVIIFLLPIVKNSKFIDYLLLGEERSFQLGVDVFQVKLKFLLLAAVLTGISVSFTGIIGFIGLIIPHVVSYLMGRRGLSWILSSALMGASFLLICDVISRTIILPKELPIGVVTAMVGAPYLIFMIRRGEKTLT